MSDDISPSAVRDSAADETAANTSHATHDVNSNHSDDSGGSSDAQSDVKSNATSDDGSHATDVVEPEAPAPAPPPMAVWTIREPDEPWCPEAFLEPLTRALGKDMADRLLARSPHERGEHAQQGDWTITGALKRGRRHAHVGAFNEDALFVHLGASRGVLVVADGAGSSAYSRIGSTVAVEIVGAALRNAAALNEAAAHDAMERAVSALQAIATGAKVDAKALRTTVLVAAWEPSATGTRVLTMQVGDGALVLAHQDGRVSRPTAGDAGEWSGEVHCFVPDSETMTYARKATVLTDVPDLAALLLVTDGVDDAMYPFPKYAPLILGQLVHGADAPLTGLNAQPVTPSLLASNAPGDVLLTWLGFEKRGENDDRTLAVALHRSAPQAIAPWAP